MDLLILSHIISGVTSLMFGWIPLILFIIAFTIQELDNNEKTVYYPYPNKILPWYKWVASIKLDNYGRAEAGSIIATLIVIIWMALCCFLLPLFISHDLNVMPFHITWITILFVFTILRRWVNHHRSMKATHDRLRGEC